MYVVVDRLTKFTHFFAIPLEYKVTRVVEFFFKEVLDSMGCLRTLSVIGTIGFLVHFGRGCSNWPTQS
jgi:hypothetical protein